MAKGNKSLEKTFAKLQSAYGETSVMMASDIPAYDVFSSGSMSLDYAIGIGGLPTNRVVEIAGEEGVGKALALDTPIATINGWKTMGDIEVGDVIFDEKGQKTTVTGTYEVEKPNGTYCVTFDDKSTITACGDHLWTVWTSREKASWRRSHSRVTGYPEDWATWEAPSIFGKNAGIGAKTFSTVDMSDKLRNESNVVDCTIPNTLPVQYEKKKLPLDPWVFGYWIGSGKEGTARVRAKKLDMEDVMFIFALKKLRILNVRDVKSGPDSELFDVPGVFETLNKMGVLDEKRIPDEYMRSSVDQRKKLLAGILDASGGVGSDGVVDFHTKNENLAEYVEELALSLGQKVYTTRYQYPNRISYRLSWTPTFNPHLIQRKSDRFSLKGVGGSARFISSIEKIESDAPMRCLQVDSPSHLYLAGKQFIPTHNTTIVLHAVNAALKKFPNKFALYIDAEHRLTPDWVANFVEDQDRVLVVKPDHVEQATDMYVEAVTTGECAVAVFDSIGGTPSQRVTNKSAEIGNIGGNALSVTRFSQFAQINSGKYQTCTIGINQKRDDMDGYNRLMTPGGRAWKHAASLRIELKRGKGKVYEKIDGENVQVGKSIVAKIHKNSLAAPGKTTSFWFYNIPSKYGFGIDHVDEIARLAILTGVVYQANQVSYQHELFPDGKIRGRDNVFEFIKSNPDVAEKISAEVMASLKEKPVSGIVAGFDPDNDPNNEGMDLALQNDLGAE